VLLAAALPARAGSGEAVEFIRQHCFLRIFPGQAGFTAEDTLLLRRPQPGADSIDLFLLPRYEVAAVQINGRPVPFSRRGEHLVLLRCPAETVLTAAISYSGTIDPHSEFSRIGSEEAALRSEEILPGGSRTIGETVTSVEVPAGWQVYAPGEPAARRSTADSLVTTYRLDSVAPVLGWICAGRRSEYADSGVTVALMPDDSARGKGIAERARDILRVYGSMFTPYRFPRLTIVEVEDWIAGRGVLAIAVPGMILVKHRALHAASRFDRVEAVLPHEIAHQWWPMTVFIDDTDAALLSEGMCEYSALLYGELQGTLSVRDSLQHHPLLRSLLRRIARHQDLPLRRKIDLRALPTHYLKSSFVHSMLRKIIGDSAFFRLYHEWAVRFRLKETSQDDFERLAEEISGKKLRWFFDQWTGGGGIPRFRLYNVRTAASGGGWTTRGRVRIVGYEKFTSPVEIGCDSAAGTGRCTAWLGEDSTGVYRNDVPFSLVTPRRPRRVIADPSGVLLKYQKMPVKISDLSDPGSCTMIVGSTDPSGHLAGLARRDSSEMDRSGWSVTVVSDRQATLADLQRDDVLLYGRADENSAVGRLLDKFPFRVSGDSVTAGGETVADSSLTLVQAIENPYLADGMIVWIAPAGARSNPELLPYEASWTVLRGREEILSGTWEETDPDLVVPVP